MSIRFDSERKLFTLTTKNTMYQMQLTALGHLLQLLWIL